MDRCKGVDNTLTPQIIDLKCPKCGADLEMFSNEEQVVCKCGETLSRETNPALSVG